jgi:group I intron endonuclease
MRDRLCGIYRVMHIGSRKSYVGLSIDIYKRWASHRAPKASSKSALHCAIRKYGADCFDFSILELCGVGELEQKEREWIERLDTFLNGYNLTTGGEAAREVSEDTKRKLSVLNSGKKRGPLSEATKAKIGAANKGKRMSAEFYAEKGRRAAGRKQSDEWRMKAALARTGMKHSEETKKKMSENTAFRRPEFRELLITDNPMKRPEVRALMSSLMKGRTFSEETRRKMSEAAKARCAAKRAAKELTT